MKFLNGPKPAIRDALVAIFDLLTSKSTQVSRFGLKVVARTALKNKGLLLTSFLLTLITTFFEGGTIALLTLAVSVLVDDGLPTFGDYFGNLGPALNQWAEKQESGQLFIFLVLLAVTSQLLRTVLVFLSKVVSINVITRIEQQLLDLATSQIMQFSYSEISKYSSGELSEKINTAGEMSRIARIGHDGVLSILMLSMYLALMLTMSPLLTLVCLILIIGLGLCLTWSIRKFKRLGIELAGSSIETSTVIVEFLNASRMLRIFGATRYANKIIRARRRLMIEVNRKALVLKATIAPTVEIFTVMVLATFLIVGYIVLDSATESIPSLFLFVLVLHRAMPQVQGLGLTLGSIAHVVGGLRVVGELMRRDDKEFLKTGGIKFDKVFSQIKLEDMTFYHSGESVPALSDIDIVLSRGKTLAVVGPSGAGKSTLADLILGLRQPGTGRVLVDGIDLSELNREHWLHMVGAVDQDVFLLNDSIANNIRFGLEGLPQEQVVDAAKLANAHDFISNLAEGYETKIGDRGIRLSGGQKQRIAIARALAKKPELLILDEATSALDSESERLIQQTLNRLKNSHMVLVIAHRLSTVMTADEVIVLDKGNIVERGEPEKLRTSGGAFSLLWKTQVEANK